LLCTSVLVRGIIWNIHLVVIDDLTH
jgi:hypothetical protein